MKVIECKKLSSLFQLLLTNNAYADPIIRNMEEIAESQSVDPVHAAGGCYCRECEYCAKVKGSYANGKLWAGYICDYFDREVNCTDFCSYGEPKEAQKDD